jgi:hypothetical protein
MGFNGKKEHHPRFHPLLADEIHPSDGGEFLSDFGNQKDVPIWIIL